MSRVAERARPERTAPASSPAVGEANPSLTKVPRPQGKATVVALEPLVAGGLTALQAEWGVDGGVVVLTGGVPFADVSGRAGFRADGSLDGVVRMRTRVGFLGLDLGEVAWTVHDWSPEAPLATPAITLRGSTLAVDLGPLPRGATWTAPGGIDAPRHGDRVVVHLPGEAMPPGLPLSPRLAEVYRGLGLDVSHLRVHPDIQVGGAPAFVTDENLFLAPGIHGVDSPETLRILDAAVRAALTGLLGAVGGEPASVVPPAPAGTEAPAAASTVVPASVPEGPAGPAQVEAAASPETAPAVEGAEAEAVPEEPSAEAAEAPPVVQLIMPEPPTDLTPAAAARGQAVKGSAGRAARAARDLPTAEATVADSRAAVTEPAAETAARAREELAAELGARPAPSPEIVELCERIRTAIRSNRPEDEDELLESDPTKEAQQAGSTVTGSVEGQVQQVGSSYDAMASPPPGTPALTPDPLQKPSPTSPGMGVEAGSAAPDPIPPENTTLDADVAATDQKIADSGIDTRVTREIPDGPFAAAREARAGLGEVAERTPQQIQAEQQQAIDSAQADMAQLQQQAVAALRGARSGTVKAVGGGQTAAVTSEEQTRESVARRAQQIYDDAQKQVDALLQPLSRTAIARWEAGLARLSQEFHDSLDRVKRWIDERHSGVGGTLLAIGDYISGLPDWVTDEYNRAERAFGDGVCELLTSISSDVNGVIAAARAVIRHARTDIDGAFQAMEAEFPEWAAQERARFGGMLDGLDSRVGEAQSGFVRDVSQRAVTAVNQVHAEAQALREEAGGLIGRVVAAIEEFIDDPVRAIINGLLRLVGIPPAAFWALVAKIEQVISDIADDPENFVNNLVAGVKQGFEQFFDNFGTHVLHGFWDWLFSGLKTPVPMPRDLSAKSLFTFALQLMGITWPRVREILVRHVGPTAVEVVEAAWQLVSVLIERGPDGLVELVKEQLAPENIVGMILDAAVDYLVETLIEQVVVRVVGLLNPVGAIAQAIDLIYQVCAWIFRNAARIFRFVEAVVNGMADVVAGNIAGLAASVEKALASLIPPVIDFLAGLLHLGELPGEVAQVITRLQEIVYAAMDRVIGYLAAKAIALLKRLGIGGDKDGKHGADDELGTTVRFTAADESHRLFVRSDGKRAELVVASQPTTISVLITDWEEKLKQKQPGDEEKRVRAAALIEVLKGASATADAEATRLVELFDKAARDPKDTTEPPDDSTLEASQRSVADTLDALFELFGEDERKENLKAVRTALPPHGLARTEKVLDSWKEEYIDPPEAKPLDGSRGKVWFVSSFQPADLVPSEVLDSGTQHVKLLKYFEDKERRGGAETTAFHDYALVRTEPGHDVRAHFFRSLGSRVAARLRTEAVARIGPEDSDLLAKVRSITYKPSGSDYGSFVPPFDSPVSVLLPKVIVPDGVMVALRTFVAGGKVGGVDLSEFLVEVRRDAKGRSYLGNAIRNIETGQHEWLPVSIADEVLQHAFETGREDLKKGLGWISLLQTLRSPTNGVLWQIVRDPVVVPGEKPQQGRVLDPHGHVAALSRDRFTLVQDGLTVGTGQFHDALRDFFRKNRSMDPAAWVDALLAHLPTIMWTGSNTPLPAELLNQPIGVFFAMPSGLYAPDLTVAQVQAEVQERFERQIVAAFRAAKAGIR
ncbi:hypothetical protein AB0I00_05900 [Streptomyces sp. NPDC050803]|uniref:hypothetical protein n=1 Tax=unclassified Streptomyces TaxID=2593676 RepID=UPI00343FC7EB